MLVSVDVKHRSANLHSKNYIIHLLLLNLKNPHQIAVCLVQEVLSELVMDKSFLDCAGSLMVEHPIMSQYVEKIEGAASVTILGLSTPLVSPQNF